MAETFSTAPLSLDEEIRREPLLDLGASQEPPHSDEFLEAQSARLHLALRDRSPGMNEVSAALRSGNDEVYRRMLSDQDEINQIERRNDVLESILQSDPSMIDQNVVSVVQGLSNMEVVSPDIGDIIEKKYAQMYTDTAAASLDNGILDEAMETDPDTSLEILDRAERMAYKQNYTARLLDEAQKQIQDQSWAGSIYNTVENMFLGRYQTYGQVDEEFVSSVLPGANRQEQYAYLHGIQDMDEYRRVLDAVDQDLRERNPYTRQQWLQGLVSYGNLDATLETIEAGLDVAQFIPLGKLKNAAKAIVLGSTKNPTKVYEVATQLGKYGDASVGKVIEDVAQGTFEPGNIRNIRELSNSVPSIMDPEKLLSGIPKNVPTAAYLRVKDSLLQRAELARKFLSEPNLIDRATPEELVQYGGILRRDYVKENPSIQKNVIDVEVAESADLGNVYQAKVILGKRDGTLFESEKQAESYFKRFVKGTDDYQITQKGEGFQIEINKNVDETKFMTDLKLGTTQRTPESLSDTFAGVSWMRTPAELLSEQQSQARAVAVSTKELLDSVYSRLSEPFRNLKKNELSELQDLMVDNQKQLKYYENYGQFEDAFYERFKKLPSENQVDTYFAYVQLNDLDLIVRDLDVYKQKARMGIENMRLKIGNESLEFEGRVVNDLPYNSSSPFRLGGVEDGALKRTKFSSIMGESDRLEIKKLVDQGYKIVNATDPNFKIGDKYLDYVLVRDLTRNRIGVKNIERRAGGHKVQKYPYYIKQAIISGDDEVSFYRGDKTFFNFRSQREANEFLEVLEEARQKLLRNDPDAMKFLRDNIPVGTQEFMAAVKAGDINLNVPFTTTRSGMRALDTGAYSGIKNLKDGTNNPHKPSILGRYLGERSEADINTIISEGNRQFEIAPAPYLSPMDALKTATSDMMSTRVMNDYSLMTRDNFIREFSDILQGTLEEQRAQGMSILSNPVFKQGVEQTQLEKVQRAKNVSRSYNNLMNQGTALDRRVEIMKEKLLSKILPKLGPRGQQWVEDKMLSTVKDPGAFWRSAAFHMKLGMFNPIQYFKQANQLVAVVSIGGTNGMKSGLLYPFLRSSLLTNSDEILLSAGKKAEALGLMKADEYVESIKMYKRSGFNEIGHDVAYIDDLRSPELVQSPLRKGMKKLGQAGTTFFQEGERVARLAGWNTAYLERKAALRGAKMTKRDEAAILVRAKLLAGNMSREMNAPWQKGYAATMTQFFGYQVRIMEQMLGKQLTAAEKARLFTGYSVMYGVPTALGATAGIIPVRDWIVDYLNEEGIDYSDPAAQVFLDGFASEMTKFMFGKDLNIASSYGPGGLPTFYDLFRGDKDLTEVLLGASGGVALQTISDSIPALKGMASEFMDYEGGYYNLTIQDLIKPFRNISSINSAAQMYEVYNLGIWASKNGINLTEMDIPEGLAATLMGLQPASIEESFSKYRATKAGKEEFKSDQKEMIRQYRNAMKIEDSATRDQMIKDIKAQMILKGFTIQEMKQTWRYAADTEMMTDVFFENYEKLRERKERQRAAQEVTGG